MPAPLAVDKEAVRVLVVALGVREAARKLELNENTVLDWSRQGNWLAHTRPQAKQELPLSMQSRPIAPIKPADALAAEIRENTGAGKLGLSKWARKAGQHLAELDGDEALAAHQAAASVATVVTKLSPEQAKQSMRISLFAHDVEMQVEQVVDAEVIDLPTT